jgi:hypothetical protein
VFLFVFNLSNVYKKFLPKHLEIGEKFCIFAKQFSSVSENQDFGAGISDG